MLRKLSRGGTGRRVLAAGVCALALGAAAPRAGAAVEPSPSAGAACADQSDAVRTMNPSRAWSLAGTQGEGASIDVVGTDEAIAEATCTIKALAPQVAVRPMSVSTGGPALQVARRTVAAATTQDSGVVLFADESVQFEDPQLQAMLQDAEAAGTVVIAAAGDSNSQMSWRPADVINVAAADATSNRQHPGSDFGQNVTLAGYGPDTSYASGYVAAAATLLHLTPGRRAWTVPQVAAQLAGSINQTSGSPRQDDEVGWGILNLQQALSAAPIPPEAVPGLSALFPVVHPTSSASPSSGGQPTTELAGSTQNPDATDALGQPVQPPAAAKSHGSGGIPLVPVLAGVVVLGLGVTYFQRRRWRAMPEPLKERDEWDAPQGPRHSGYSSPPE